MQLTTNYNFEKPEGTDFISPSSIANNAQKCDEMFKLIKDLTDKLSISEAGKLLLNGEKVGETDSDKISVNIEGITGTNVQSALEELKEKTDSAFQSASDGKIKLANAITGISGDANSSMTFDQLAAAIVNIKNIRKRVVTGTTTKLRRYYRIDDIEIKDFLKTLPFTPRMLLFKDYSETNYNYKFLLMCNIKGWIYFSSDEESYNYRSGNRSILYGYADTTADLPEKITISDYNTKSEYKDEYGNRYAVRFYAFE